ncbi:MAG: hypothetical protein ACXWH7_13710 [Thermoanaerobaculia bacterium]
MARVVVRSRSGNVALAVRGAIYSVGAIAALVAFAVDVWNAAAITDHALQLGLIAAAACGVWFLLTGLENLGVHVGKGLTHFTHRSS